MTETSINRTKSAFYRNVILPSKTYKEKPKLSSVEVKNVARTYNKQRSLKKADTDKYRNALQRQLSVDMLRQGNHKSFRELCDILAWQKEDRDRLGVEHPLYRRPLLDAETDKLRILCIYLNKAEEAERKREYSTMYKSYLEIASFFSKSDDYWLSDSFYEKCLRLAQTYPQLDPQLAAGAYLNIGLSYERRGDHMKALKNIEKYRELSEPYYQLKMDANLQLIHLYMKLSERRTGKEAVEYIIKAYEASEQNDDKRIENDISYKLGHAYLEQDDIDLAIKYIHRYYDYCLAVNDNEGFGQASEVLAICYQKKSDVKKSSEYLKKYLERVANKEGDNQYAKACSALGIIQTTLGDYDSAIESSSKAYSISLANSHTDLDRNRVLYGIANGLKLRSFFNDHINHTDTDVLIQWKSIPFDHYLAKFKT